jgi:hypothetical protein
VKQKNIPTHADIIESMKYIYLKEKVSDKELKISVDKHSTMGL